jgi:osmotically-inducible protein OsmY
MVKQQGGDSYESDRIVPLRPGDVDAGSGTRPAAVSTMSSTFFQEQVPREQMPPDQQAPPPRVATPEKVQQQIEQHLNSETALQNSKLSVHVDEDVVVLSGTVGTEQQHDLRCVSPSPMPVIERSSTRSSSRSKHNGTRTVF